MTANTGYNDPNSIYNSGALSWATGLGNTAANIIGALRSPAPTATTSATNAQNGNPTGTGTSNKTLWIVGGLVAVVALILWLRK